MSLDALRGTHDVARRLARLLAHAPGDAPELRALHPGPPPARAVAVDGSSVVLATSGDLVLAALRAGSIGVEKGEPMRADVLPAEVVLLAPGEARHLVAARLAEHDVGPELLPARLDPHAALDALRALAETTVAMRALGSLDEGDLLLLDGALQARAHAPLLERTLARAAQRGVEVVAVAKSTSLTLGRAPALVACQLAARAFPASTWWAPLPTPPAVRGASFAARLSGAEERAFRFDVASGRPDALAHVAALCGHPAYPGYPSPLAMAHNAVLLNEDARRRLLAQVQTAALDAGADARAWDAAFVDYHDVLEIGA